MRGGSPARSARAKRRDGPTDRFVWEMSESREKGGNDALVWKYLE